MERRAGRRPGSARRPAIASREQIIALGHLLATWVIWECRMREIARRPWAVIDGEVVTQEVVYHSPDDIRDL